MNVHEKPEPEKSYVFFWEGSRWAGTEHLIRTLAFSHSVWIKDLEVEKRWLTERGTGRVVGSAFDIDAFKAVYRHFCKAVNKERP